MTPFRPSRPRRPALFAGIAVAVLLAIAGCSETVPPTNEPQPDTPLGFVALDLANLQPPRFSSRAGSSIGAQAATVQGPIADAGITIQASGNASVLAIGDAVYVSHEYLITNGSDAALENLVLLGYHRQEFRDATAVSQPLIAAGQPANAAQVRAIRPTQTLYYEGSAADPDLALLGVEGRSDFVAFQESELPDLTGSAAVTTVFPYGFAVRDALDGTSRTIVPSGQGRVHVAFALPNDPLTGRRLASFTWNAVLVTVDEVRVAQAREENHPAGWQGVLDRAARASADTIVAIGPGSRDTPAGVCSAVLGLADVRTAGSDASDPDYVGLVPTPGAPDFTGCEGAP